MWVGGGAQLLLFLFLILLSPLHARRRTQHKGVSWQNRIANQWVVREWSSWSDWSSCSRTCGGGVQQRSRSCRTTLDRDATDPVRTGAAKCLGEAAEYRICNDVICPANATNYRQEQCSRYNQWTVHGYSVREWEPTPAGNPCELRCIAKDYGFHYSFGKVDDGTKCDAGKCVNGRCLPRGCGTRLGTKEKEDMCGVCGGRNETCVHKKGQYDGELPVGDQPAEARRHYPGPIGYYPVTTVPEGSRHLQVTDHSRNMLAVADNYGKYYLNGGYVIKGPGKYEDMVGDTRILYEHKDDNTETLTAEGPIDQDLTVMVLLRDYNPGVVYEFWEPSGKSQIATTSMPSIDTELLPTSTKAETWSGPPGDVTTTTSLSNVIPGGRTTKGKRKKKKKRRKKKGGTCPRGCKKTRKARKHYCVSDAVLRGRVRNVEGIPGQWRIELDVIQSFKNKIPLLFREFLWGEDFCICPELRPGREYVLMATSQGHSGREVRLVVNYVRKYSNKNVRRLLKLRRDEHKVCKKYQIYKNRDI